MDKYDLKKLAILRSEIKNNKHDRKLKRVYKESMKGSNVNIIKYKEAILEIIDANLSASTHKTTHR